MCYVYTCGYKTKFFVTSTKSMYCDPAAFLLSLSLSLSAILDFIDESQPKAAAPPPSSVATTAGAAAGERKRKGHVLQGQFTGSSRSTSAKTKEPDMVNSSKYYMDEKNLHGWSLNVSPCKHVM